MKKRNITISLFLLLFVGIVGCNTESSNPNYTKRTYPHALNLNKVGSVQQLENNIAPPDSANIKAYVITIIGCPPHAMCVLGSSIIISDSLQSGSVPEDSRIIFNVTNPLQFNRGQQYLFSLGIYGNSGKDNKYYRLLGYNKL